MKAKGYNGFRQNGDTAALRHKPILPARRRHEGAPPPNETICKNCGGDAAFDEIGPECPGTSAARPVAVVKFEQRDGIAVAVGTMWEGDAVSKYPANMTDAAIKPSKLSREEKRETARQIHMHTGISFDDSLKAVEAGCADKCVEAYSKRFDAVVKTAHTEAEKAFRAMFYAHTDKRFRK